MTERLVTDEFVLRGRLIELWIEHDTWWLCLPEESTAFPDMPRNTVLGEDDFEPPLTDREIDDISIRIRDFQEWLAEP